MTTDPTGLTGPRLMVSVVQLEIEPTGPRHIGSGLSGNRTMATGPTEARATANGLTGSDSWS